MGGRVHCTLGRSTATSAERSSVRECTFRMASRIFHVERICKAASSIISTTRGHSYEARKHCRFHTSQRQPEVRACCTSFLCLFVKLMRVSHHRVLFSKDWKEVPRLNSDSHARARDADRTDQESNRNPLARFHAPQSPPPRPRDFDPQPGEYLDGLQLSHARTLVLPRNPAVREYQRSIIQACVMKNTLVSLPTGLGKTLIAAVVMHNYLRWFPGKKVVFMAPSVSIFFHA